MDERPQHKMRYTKSVEQKVGSNLELIGIRDNFLNRTLMTQTLRSTIDKSDLR